MAPHGVDLSPRADETSIKCWTTIAARLRPASFGLGHLGVARSRFDRDGDERFRSDLRSPSYG